MLQWLLLICLLPRVGCRRINIQDYVYKEQHINEEIATPMRPDIYYCRSPNMEHFNCWWHPLRNVMDTEVTYILTYSIDKEPKQECPDYKTGGPNSCHFDRSHTRVWNVYCMNVTAITAVRNYTSRQHCLDVADIVETEAPVNLTYELADAGGHEMAHNALLSWKYPAPNDLQYGWITLIYELHYRQATEPENWKVKASLREPQAELLSLPVGDYVVRVRCRSKNSLLWSKWSTTMLMTIPSRPSAGKLLVRILAGGFSIGALLVIAIGVIPRSKRIKDYFLPPIPKPRIKGIDSLLLKKGNLDEINIHLSNFHSYRPPSYTEEVWEQVSADNVCLTLQDCSALAHPGESTPAAHYEFLTPNPASYVQSMSPYCLTPSPDAPSPSTTPQVVSLPRTEYTTAGHPSLPRTTAVATNRSQQDFYTCVQLMKDSGEVHLVPCLPPAYCRDFPPVLGEEEKKKEKMADYHTRTNSG